MKVTEKEIEAMGNECAEEHSNFLDVESCGFMTESDLITAKANYLSGYIAGFKQAQSMNEWVFVTDKITGDVTIPLDNKEYWALCKSSGKVIVKHGWTITQNNTMCYTLIVPPSPPQI